MSIGGHRGAFDRRRNAFPMVIPKPRSNGWA
jgi:hypothetical protein